MPSRATAADRGLDLTATSISTIPDRMEEAAPTRKAIPVRIPRSSLVISVSENCSKRAIRAATRTAATRATAAMVSY